MESIPKTEKSEFSCSKKQTGDTDIRATYRNNGWKLNQSEQRVTNPHENKEMEIIQLVQALIPCFHHTS